jgi:hypothetical protein
MRRITQVLIGAASLFMGLNALQAQSGPLQTMAEFPGTSMKWFHIAEPEFKKHHLDLDNCKVVIEENGDLVEVTLQSNDDKPRSKGSSGSHPDFTVEINRSNLKIVKFYYDK